MGSGRPSCFQSCAGPIDRWCSAVLADYIYICIGDFRAMGSRFLRTISRLNLTIPQRSLLGVPSGELSVEF